MEFFQLQEPSDQIFDVLLSIAKAKKLIKEIKGPNSGLKKVYDVDAAGHYMVKCFFDGHLGQSMLDSIDE